MNLKKTSSAILSTSIKIVVYMLVAVGIYVILSGAFSFGELIFSENGMAAKGNGTEIQVTIPKDASSKEVGDILKKNGLIENSYAFVIQVMLYEADIVPASATTTAITPLDLYPAGAVSINEYVPEGTLLTSYKPVVLSYMRRYEFPDISCNANFAILAATESSG